MEPIWLKKTKCTPLALREQAAQRSEWISAGKALWHPAGLWRRGAGEKSPGLNIINQLQEDFLSSSEVEVYFYLSCSPPQLTQKIQLCPCWNESSFQGRLVLALLQVWGIEHPLISHFPKIKVTLLHKRMTAEVLCTESDPLTLYWHFSPGSEQQQALILQEVPELKALFTCPTTCSRSIQQPVTKKTLLASWSMFTSPFPQVLPLSCPSSSRTQHKHPPPSQILFLCLQHQWHCVSADVAQEQLTASFKTVSLHSGVGFWRGQYDLAVEMPLSSHLFQYLLPPREPALLWTILPLQYLTYTNINFNSPLLPQASLCSPILPSLQWIFSWHLQPSAPTAPSLHLGVVPAVKSQAGILVHLFILSNKFHI